MNICIIVPKGLPVPAVRGGAIEKLVNNIIDENEKQKKMNITVCSIYDVKAEEQSKKYKQTEFIYIKKDIQYMVKATMVRLKNIFLKYNFNTYNEIVLDKIKNKQFDYILVEDGAFMSFYSYKEIFGKQKMILHFHHNGNSTDLTDKTFSKFIGVSKFVVDTFKRSSSIEDMKVLRNGIDIDTFNKQLTKEQKKEIKQRLGFNNNDFIVLFCGRLIEEKGVLELIKAIKAIDNCKIKLLIVGNPDISSKNNKEYISKINNEIKDMYDRVKFTGRIEYNDLYKYYKISDVGVISSICEDAAPLVAIEMMANELPMIITKTGGAPEYISRDTIVIPKDERIIQNIKDKIIYLYNNEDIINKMKINEKEQSTNYTIEKFYNDFIKIFK